MPVRGNTKSHRSLVGVVASRKSVGPASFESSLERDFFEILDFEPGVREFEVQPLRVPFRDPNNQPRSYTPDVFVAWHEDRPWLCEIKFRVDLFRNWSDLKPRFKAARAFCRAEEWEFRILTENEIRTDYLANVRFLRHYLKPGRQAAKEHCEWVLDELTRTSRVPAHELIESMSHDKWTRGFLIYALWQLVAEGKIRADLNTRVSLETTVSIHEH